MYISPADFTGSDSERLNRAVRQAAEQGLPVRIGKRPATPEDPRDWWLLDTAILVPSHTRMILENCKLKLSDACRDNFIRSANCISGETVIPPAEDIHITGIGSVVFEGADAPRSTGDSGKQNMAGTEDYVSSYGSDGLVPGAPATWGDWRNIGILLVRVHDFTLSGFTVQNPHCWSISLEYCTRGTVQDITFDSTGFLEIRGRTETIRNQDGLDLRRGCQYIHIENIRGCSGDDVIALAALGTRIRPSGQEKTTEFCGMHPEREINDTCFITIRNVQAYCAGGHHIVRFLNNKGVRLHHIRLEDLRDTSPADFHCNAAVKVGDLNYGGLANAGDTYELHLAHIQSNARTAVLLAGPLTDSEITDVTEIFPEGRVLAREAPGEQCYRQLTVSDLKQHHNNGN